MQCIKWFIAFIALTTASACFEPTREDCIQRAGVSACDAGPGDVYVYVKECNEEKVCTEPRQ